MSDLRDELISERDDLTASDTLTLSILPPLSPTLSAPRVCDLLLELFPKGRADTPRVLAHVASERAAARLNARASPDAHRPHVHSIGDPSSPIAVELVMGDITRTHADAIVNASNTRLILGGGVSGAIARAATATLQADMTSRLPPSGRIAHGDVVTTLAHGLTHTSCILHAATARGRADDVARALGACLDIATRFSLESIAIPALGTGTGGLSITTSAHLTRTAITSWAARTPEPSLRRITVVLWTAPDLFAFDLAFKRPTTPA